VNYKSLVNQPFDFFVGIYRCKKMFQLSFQETSITLFKCLSFLWYNYPIIPPLYVIYPGILEKFKDKFTRSKLKNFYDSPLYWSHLIAQEYTYNKQNYVKQTLGIMKKLNNNPNLRILEVGSGVGSYTAHFLKIGHVTTVDIARRSLGLIRYRFGNRVSEVISSVDALPFHSPQFDFVVCLDVLEHIADPRPAVDRLIDSLSKNGFLLTNYAIDYPELDHIGVLSLQEFERYLETKNCVTKKFALLGGSSIYAITKN
jgi:2-polyprenyl-3-methyl-5-hydroxy-6-metoxy-1,4-benzoquinol methylase